jgi:hypothetical protein
VIEQITYLTFIKLLDELHTVEDARQPSSRSRWSC